MTGLRAWSARRIALLWAAWLGAALLLPLALVAWAFWQSARAERLARAPVLPEGTGVFLPAQLSDFAVSVVWPALGLYALLVLVPPALLTLLWWRRRARLDRDRPT